MNWYVEVPWLLSGTDGVVLPVIFSSDTLYPRYVGILYARVIYNKAILGSYSLGIADPKMSSFMTILRQMNGGSARDMSRLDFLFETLEEDEVTPVEIAGEVPLQIYNLVANGKVYVADTHTDCGIPFQAFGMFAFGDGKNYCVTVDMDYSHVPKPMQESLWCNELEADFSKFLTVGDGTVESLKQEAFKHVTPIEPDDKIGMEIWNLIDNGKLFADSVMSVSGIVKYKDGYLLLRDS